MIENLNESGSLKFFLFRFVCTTYLNEMEMMPVYEADKAKFEELKKQINEAELKEKNGNECRNGSPLRTKWNKKFTKEICSMCGNGRFINCLKCNGARKRLIYHFAADSIWLRCVHCNSAGLQPCPQCE